MKITPQNERNIHPIDTVSDESDKVTIDTQIVATANDGINSMITKCDKATIVSDESKMMINTQTKAMMKVKRKNMNYEKYGDDEWWYCLKDCLVLPTHIMMTRWLHSQHTLPYNTQGIMKTNTMMRTRTFLPCPNHLVSPTHPITTPHTHTNLKPDTKNESNGKMDA